MFDEHFKGAISFASCWTILFNVWAEENTVYGPQCTFWRTISIQEISAEIPRTFIEPSEMTLYHHRQPVYSGFMNFKAAFHSPREKTHKLDQVNTTGVPSEILNLVRGILKTWLHWSLVLRKTAVSNTWRHLPKGRTWVHYFFDAH